MCWFLHIKGTLQLPCQTLYLRVFGNAKTLSKLWCFLYQRKRYICNKTDFRSFRVQMLRVLSAIIYWHQSVNRAINRSHYTPALESRSRIKSDKGIPCWYLPVVVGSMTIFTAQVKLANKGPIRKGINVCLHEYTLMLES